MKSEYLAEEKGEAATIMEEKLMENVKYTATFQSPIGRILLEADEMGITGLWFDKRKLSEETESSEESEQCLSFFEPVKRWLTVYFTGKEPDFVPPIHLNGTAFQRDVWDILLQIPYGKTMTYGEVAGVVAGKRGIARMSAQAVGGAVGSNPISIIVPCHRVVGANGSLTGYAGGIQRKAELLTLEGVDMGAFFIPVRGTAL